MMSNTEDGRKNVQKQSMYVNSSALLKFFLGTDDTIDTLIKCKGTEIDLMTSDYDLYEALASLRECDDFRTNKLVKLLEVIDVVSFRKNKRMDKPVLTHMRVEELRALAMKKEDNDDNKSNEP